MGGSSTGALRGRSHGRPSVLSRGATKVWILTAILGSLGTYLYFSVVQSFSGFEGPLDVPWWIFAGLFYASEVFVVHLHFRREAYTFSLNEIPIVIALFFGDPSSTIPAMLLGSAIALLVHRRQAAVKAVFNLANFNLQVIMAMIVFHTFTQVDPLGPAGWAAAFGAVLPASILGYVLIGIAISLSEGRLQLAALMEGSWVGVAVTLTNVSLALLAVAILWTEPRATWLLAIPTVMLLFAYRAYTHERSKHESIESLYATSRMTHGTLKVEDAMRTLLTQACEMFRAEIAMITLFPTEKGAPYLRTTFTPGKGSTFMEEMDMDPARGVWARVAAEEQAVLVARPIQNEAVRAFYAEQGIKDAMVAPLHGEDRVVGVIHVCNRLGDVTTFNGEDLKLFETLVNHASVSIENARLVGKLEDSLAHLTEMNRLKDDFVASVSHELRTPLTSIRGYVQTLLRPDVDFDADERRSFLETVDRQSGRLHRLIEDLLAVSRIESETDPSTLAPVSLRQLAEDVADELRSKADGHDIELDLPPELPLVETDPGKVHQILCNLVDNALKYTAAGTTIVVAGAPAGNGVSISVTDQGAGIPLDAQEKIFDRFYQFDQSATRAVGGAGLGLYICRRMAEAIGGRVWLEKSDEEGSTFSLWIPTQVPLPRATAASLN